MPKNLSTSKLHLAWKNPKPPSLPAPQLPPRRYRQLGIVLCICGIALMMMGCAQQTVRSTTPPLPPELTHKCPPLTPLEGKTGGHVLRKLVEVAALYHECADRHNATVDVVTPHQAP